MSKKHSHSQFSQEVREIMNHYATMDKQEFMDTYGVELLEDEKVFDPIENLKYNSIREWAEVQVNENDQIGFEHFGSHSDRDYDEWA